MIQSFCDLLRKQLREDIEARRDTLETGSPNDERVRGEIWGLRTAKAMIDELEERARKASASGDDMF